MREKKRAKQFFQKHTYSASKNCRKKSSGKSAKNFFYIHTNIVTQKGGKTRETSFPETHELCVQKMLGKNRRSNGQKRFLYRDQKMWGKNARNNLS